MHAPKVTPESPFDTKFEFLDNYVKARTRPKIWFCLSQALFALLYSLALLGMGAWTLVANRQGTANPQPYVVAGGCLLLAVLGLLVVFKGITTFDDMTVASIAYYALWIQWTFLLSLSLRWLSAMQHLFAEYRSDPRNFAAVFDRIVRTLAGEGVTRYLHIYWESSGSLFTLLAVVALLFYVQWVAAEVYRSLHRITFYGGSGWTFDTAEGLQRDKEARALFAGVGQGMAETDPLVGPADQSLIPSF